MIVLTVLVVGLLTAALVWAVGARPGSLSDQALADPTSSSPYAGLPDGPVVTSRMPLLTGPPSSSVGKMNQSAAR